MRNPFTFLHSKAPNGLLIYFLGFYVLAQFCWWAYNLVNLNAEIYQLKLDYLTATENFGPEYQILKAQLDQKLSLRIWMVLGEGAVFMFILTMGFWAVRRSIAKEFAVAEQQKNFLLSITHELKSPLAAIKLQLQTLHTRKLEDSKREAIYSRALNDTDRLEKLVESLLLVNKVESGGLPLHLKARDLTKFVGDQLRTSFPQEMENGTIHFNSTEILQVEMDEMAMQSILVNLIGNALKYGEGSLVEVGVATGESGQIELTIADQGGGIPDNEKERVFDRFYRRGNEEIRQTKGTGIGLYLVKLLVEKHKGQVRVTDNMPKGSRFTVTLPRVSA